MNMLITWRTPCTLLLWERISDGKTRVYVSLLHSECGRLIVFGFLRNCGTVVNKLDTAMNRFSSTKSCIYCTFASRRSCISF